MAGYVTRDEVRADTGVQPTDFRLVSDSELDGLLDRWIGYVKALIDEHYRPPRDFLDEVDGVLEDVPGSVRSVAARSMQLLVKLARESRDHAVVVMEDGRPNPNVLGQILPPWLRRDLPPAEGAAVLMMQIHHGGYGDDD